MKKSFIYFCPILIIVFLLTGVLAGCKSEETFEPDGENTPPVIFDFYFTQFYMGKQLKGFYSISDAENDNFEDHLSHSAVNETGALSSMDVIAYKTSSVSSYVETSSAIQDTGTASFELVIEDTVNNNSTRESYLFSIDRNGHDLTVLYDAGSETDFVLTASFADAIGQGMIGNSTDYEDSDKDSSTDGWDYNTESNTERDSVSNILDSLIDSGEFDDLKLYNNPANFQSKKTLLEDILINGRASGYIITVTDYTD